MRFSSQKTALPERDRESRFTRFTRRHRFLAATAALALALFSGGALAVTTSVQSASAHDGSTSADCHQISPNYYWYDGSLKNTITISYRPAGSSDAWTLKGPYVFRTSYSATTAFPDSTKSWDWKVHVQPGDNDPRWIKDASGTTTGCAAPVIDAQVTTCTSTDPKATSPIRLTFSSLTAGRSYRVTAPGLAAPFTFTAGSTPVSKSYAAPFAGGTYTVTVTDTQDSSITASKSVTAAPCPTLGAITVQAAQCTVPGQNTSVTIASDAFVPGKSYSVTTDSGYVGSPVASAAKTLTIALPTATTPSTVLVTVAFGTNAGGSQTVPVEIQPCPTQMTVTVTPEACSVGDTTRTASVALGGLTPGRSYQLQLDGQNLGQAFVASGTTQTFTDALDKVTSGTTHTVTLVDVAAPGVTATASFDAAPCAVLPTLEADPAQCTLPNSTGSLTAQLSTLVSGRSYEVVLTTGGTQVATQTVTATGPTASVPFTQLTAGKDYTVTVTDTGDRRATVSTTVTLKDCPPEPEVGGVSISCVAGSAPAITVTSDLVAGQTWTATLERQNSDGSYTAVGAPRGPLTSTAAANLTFTGLSNGSTYRATIQSNQTSTLSVSEVFAVNCPTTTPPTTTPPTTTPPTTPTGVLGTSVTALATTGADVVAPLIGGVLLLQLGAVLTVLAVLRKRREARE